MLESSVGRRGENKSKDVKIIQQIINLRVDLRVDLRVAIAKLNTLGFMLPALLLKPMPFVAEDGKYSRKLQKIIDDIESLYKKEPGGILYIFNGCIKPYGLTITKMWPSIYGKPTGLAIRGSDAYGSGAFGASRGNRTHDGADYNSIPGQPVKAPLSGVVSRISKPYSSGLDAKELSGVQIISSDGTKCWIWYMQPAANIVGTVVKAGVSCIGIARTLKNRYKNGITDHVHVRIQNRNGSKVDPSIVIK